MSTVLTDTKATPSSAAVALSKRLRPLLTEDATGIAETLARELRDVQRVVEIPGLNAEDTEWAELRALVVEVENDQVAISGLRCVTVCHPIKTNVCRHDHRMQNTPLALP